MNFVAQLEDYLRDLGAEARKKHPGVKEASERAILKLRTLQNAYVSAVRKASSSGSEHPTTALFQSQDLLHPFLLAANYPNASSKLLDISFRAMRLLMESNAICPGDGIHMVRVWTIQAHVIMSQYHKHHAPSKSATSSTAPTNASEQGDATTNSMATISQTGVASSSKYATSQAASLASSTASWLGGFIGATASSVTSGAAEAPAKTALKNVVSSSSGQSGQQYSAPSSKDMEKLALEILSCLLQLSELLRHEPSLSVELWTQSVSLCCLLLYYKKTVQQAAHSTLPQVLSILYQTSHQKFVLQTWEDLLHMAAYQPNKKHPSLQGAFSQCKFETASSNAATPPSPALALELMTTILKEQPQFLRASDKMLSKTMSVTAALLQQSTTSNHTFQLDMTLRIFQWTVVVLQTQTAAASECRELFLHVIKPIQIATEVCRGHDDFEDGFVFDGLGEAEMTSRSGRRLNGNTEAGGGTASSNSGAATSTQTYGASLVPTARLWKAGLALEAIYHVLVASINDDRRQSQQQQQAEQRETETKPPSNLLLDGDTIAVLAEAVSDFATIGASCQNHILQLVDVSNKNRLNKRSTSSSGNQGNSNNPDVIMPSLSFEEDQRQQTQPTAIEPMLFHKAESLLILGTPSDLLLHEGTAKPLSSDKKSSSSSQTRFSVMGGALWIAFHIITQIIVTTLQTCPPTVQESLAEGAFAPSLAALQHYLKRFSGSQILNRKALSGYATLADACMPALTQARSLRRKALLSSLCKLSLPSWGKYDPTSQLQNHHVRAVMCLLRIIHVHYNNILSEWRVVLWTFEELSVLAVASPVLSDQMYHAALVISAVYGRLATFSTCFTDESLGHFVDALAEASFSATEKRVLDSSNDPEVLDRILVAPEPSSTSAESLVAKSGGSADEGKESIGGKLVSLGVRAIYGAQQSDLSEHESIYDVPIAKRTKSSFFEAYRNDFVRRLEATTTTTLRQDLVHRLPFGLALLSDIALTNAFRHKICLTTISRHVCKYASVAPVIRTFVMNAVSMLILSHVSNDRNTISFAAPGRIVFEEPKQNQLLAVEPTKPSETVASVENVSQADVFGPLCECIRTVQSPAVAEAGIAMLTSILESVGHLLVGDVWAVIVDAVTSLSGDSTLSINRSSPDWSNCCLLAFRCLKLIVDDFLDHLPALTDSVTTARSSLLDCCSSFGKSRHDVNTSLTAIGLLWTIADQDAGTDAIDHALSKLVLLASDSRPEVRNCSVNTLFSCIVGRGSGFSASRWESCICETVFGVYHLVASKGSESGDDKVDLEGNSQAQSRSRYKVNVHHSRDSAEYSDECEYRPDTEIEDSEEGSDEINSDDSQDDDTDENVEKDYGDMNKDSWLLTAWTTILNFALEASASGGGRDTLDLRYAGVELLVLCGQLSCRGGIQAAVTPARVGTNMEVVNGALRSVRKSTTSPKETNYHKSHSADTEKCRGKLFAEAMDKLDCFREHLEKNNTGEDETTHVQVLHRLALSLSSLFDCCKTDELSVDNEMRDKLALETYFKAELDTERGDGDLERRFVLLLLTIAKSAVSGPRFLSQAQRCAMDLIKAMINNGSSEALLGTVQLADYSFFCRQTEVAVDNIPTNADQSGAALLGREAAALVAEEISAEAISDLDKVLSLWCALVSFARLDSGHSDETLTTYYKHFLPVISEGLRSSARINDDTETLVKQLVSDLWEGKIYSALSRMLSPVPAGTKLIKIPRVAELQQIVRICLEWVPSVFCNDLCSIVSQGASMALTVVKANRMIPGDKCENEAGRRKLKYRDDAFTLFQTCYSGVCLKQPDDPVLLSITDQAFTDALEIVDDPAARSSNNNEVAIESAVMVCHVLQSTPGTEELVVASFPLLCKLLQTDFEKLRKAAAGALGSADMRQVLQTARARYQTAERRAAEAEHRASELSAAVVDLQRKNELLQQQIAVSAIHTS